LLQPPNSSHRKDQPNQVLFMDSPLSWLKTKRKKIDLWNHSNINFDQRYLFASCYYSIRRYKRHYITISLFLLFYCNFQSAILNFINRKKLNLCRCKLDHEKLHAVLIRGWEEECKKSRSHQLAAASIILYLNFIPFRLQRITRRLGVGSGSVYFNTLRKPTPACAGAG
jgi:hypothetical protein